MRGESRLDAGQVAAEDVLTYLAHAVSERALVHVASTTPVPHEP